MGNSHNHKHSHQQHKSTVKQKNNGNPQQHEQVTKSKDPNAIDMPQFGGQVIVDKVNKLFIKEIQVFEFEQTYIKNLLFQRMQLKHPNFITVKSFQILPLSSSQSIYQQHQKDRGFHPCYPQSKVIKIYFQPALIHVNGLIKQYCKLRKPIEEQEIRRIMKSVASCLSFLKMNNTFHGDIKPTTIFIHPKTKQVQLIDSYLLSNGKTAYQIVAQNSRSESFLTPQQLQKTKTKQADTLELIYESEVFCFGLSLIEMMTFEASMEAYQLQKLEINVGFLQRKFGQMQQYGYSYQLADLALRCIHKNPQFRPTFEQIYQTL